MSNILEILETAPALIASANVKLIEAEKQHQIIVAKLSAMRNAYTIKYKDEKNATLTKAYVENESEVQDLVIKEIHADAAARIAKNDAERIENEWVSARKIAGLDEAELRAISGSTISRPA